jgi:hypothetical protein
MKISDKIFIRDKRYPVKKYLVIHFLDIEPVETMDYG